MTLVSHVSCSARQRFVPGALGERTPRGRDVAIGLTYVKCPLCHSGSNNLTFNHIFVVQLMSTAIQILLAAKWPVWPQTKDGYLLKTAESVWSTVIASAGLIDNPVAPSMTCALWV